MKNSASLARSLVRRQVLRSGFIVLAAGALLDVACAPQAAPTVAPTAAPTVAVPIAKTRKKASLRLDFFPDANHLAYFAALDNGYFAENGLDLEIGDGKGSSATLQAVGSGADTFGMARPVAVMDGVAKAVPIRTVVTWVQRNPFALLFLEKSGIRTPKDLEGKTVGLSPGGAGDAMFPYFLQLAGVDAGKVKTASVETRSKYTLVAEEKVDATTGFGFDVAKDTALFGKPWAALWFADYGVATLDQGEIANEKTIKDEPDVIRGYVAAMVKGWEFARGNLDAALASFQKFRPDTKVDKATFLESFKWMLANMRTARSQGKPIGWAAPEDWQDTETTALAAGIIKDRLPVERYFTNEFVPGR